MTVSSRAFLSKKAPYAPFEIERLPLIAHLKQIGFHNYKNRWAKRFGKKLGRLLFDVAFHHLNLSGRANVNVLFEGQRRPFQFDARKLHYSRIYDKQIDNLCEPELAVLLETFLTGDKVFYDVGSNWGYFSLYAATLPGYVGSIFAFEPIDETYSDLKDWISQLGQEERVSCHKIALSDNDGTAEMGVIPDDSGLASLARSEDQNSVKQGVQTCRLDSLKLPKPDFIKLDVEGFEYEVISGGLGTLVRDKPMIMFENWASIEDPEQTLQPIKALLDHGYKLFVPMWWIESPSAEMFWPEPHQMFPEGSRRMAYVPFDLDTRFSLRDQINFFCCHEDNLGELEAHFNVLPF